jgi:D-3-phosphoglycerate dehydrogenase / 2-oxoglutarate reductase
VKILLAGDNFVRNDLLEDAIRARVSNTVLQFTLLGLPWPEVPFGPVAEVDEASDCEDAIAQRVADVEVLVTQMAPVTERVIASASELRLVVCTRGGPVNVNVEAATRHGIAVSCTPGRNAAAVAEYALLLMLAALRRLPEAHTSLAAGEWRSGMYAYAECGNEIGDSVVGIIGFGEIGRRVAVAVRVLGGRVIAFDPFVARDSVEEGIELVSLDELLARADVVTLHARLTSETRRMIDAEALARMRPGAVLVNTARGGLLDYAAAAAALQSGRLRGLALDVFSEEPVPPDSQLLKLPGVVLSPHLAGASRQTAHRAASVAALEVQRYAAGEPLLHVVNRR